MDKQSSTLWLASARKIHVAVGILLCLGVSLHLLHRGQVEANNPTSLWEQFEISPTTSSRSSGSHNTHVALVVTSLTRDNTSWIDAFPDWDRVVYQTDNLSATFSVPANKGREAVVVLTYLIDNYDKLPEIVVFNHADRYQWHNDDPLYDGDRVLRRLQLDYVKAKGYVSLRCASGPGCPPSIKPPVGTEGGDGSNWLDVSFKRAFQDFFPDVAVPTEVGAPCCAQFAVTAARIRERPKTDYLKYRNWLLGTELFDAMSGRVMEFMWHIIFGMEANFCEPAAHCYCKAFGLCNLQCESEGSCPSQYKVVASLPEGWPERGFDGKEQNVGALRALQELDYAPRSKPLLSLHWDNINKG